MSVRKVETMTLQGNQYAKVATRIREFHNSLPAGKIETIPEFKEGWVLFKAIVTPDVAKPERCFNAHSMGKVNGSPKAYEKLETIAVGRALSFAGFMSTGEIASCEEMEDFDRETGEVKASRLDAFEDTLSDNGGGRGQLASGRDDVQSGAAPATNNAPAILPQAGDERAGTVLPSPVPAAKSRLVIYDHNTTAELKEYSRSIAGAKAYLAHLTGNYNALSGDLESLKELHRLHLPVIKELISSKDSTIAGNADSLISFVATAEEFAKGSRLPI